MKTLSLFRHGKSTWKYPVEDIYRPLNGRGLRQVTELAQSCQLSGPDLLLCSPASRTYATALIYVETLGLSWQIVQLQPGLYEADSQQLFALLRSQDDRVNALWCVGHNPGFNQLVSALLDQAQYNMVTAEYVSISLNISTWSQLGPGCGTLIEKQCPVK